MRDIPQESQATALDVQLSLERLERELDEDDKLRTEWMSDFDNEERKKGTYRHVPIINLKYRQLAIYNGFAKLVTK